MQQKIHFLILSALLMAACSNDDGNSTEELSAEGSLPIRVTASLSPSTRATGVGHIANTTTPTSLFKANQDIDLFLLEYGNAVSDATTWRYDGNTPVYLKSDHEGRFVWFDTADARTAGTPKVTKFWSPTRNSLSFFAWHPAGSITTIFSNNSFTIDTEQGAPESDAANDLMIGLPTAGNPVAPTADEIPLTFTHRLSKVTVSLKPDGGSAVITSMLEKAKITLGNDDIYLETIVNPKTGSVMTNSDGPKGTVTLKNHNVTSMDNYCVIPQQNITGKVLTIILNSGEEETFTIPMYLSKNINTEAGMAYTIELTITSENKIRLVVDVAPWTENNQDLDLRNP